MYALRAVNSKYARRALIATKIDASKKQTQDFCFPMLPAKRSTAIEGPDRPDADTKSLVCGVYHLSVADIDAYVVVSGARKDAIAIRKLIH